MNYKEFQAFVNELRAPITHLVKRYWRKPFLTETKADHSPVTEADKKIEAFIRGSIEKHFPDHGIIGEEHGSLNDDAEYVWVIDPIDGTKAFIAGEETFTTLIALCKNGVPEFGAIYQPVRDELWLGDGHTCVLNGEILSLSSHTALNRAILATTSVPYFSDQELSQFEQLRNVTEQHILNQDAYAAGRLAKGELHVLCEAGLKPYDAMALIPVIKSAGGTVTDWNGAPIRLGQPTYSLLAASDKALHKAALDVLQASVI